MRFLGFLFVIAVVLAIAGYFRGWFTVSTSTAHAAGPSNVTVRIDERKVRDDASAAGSRLGQLSAKAVEAVKSLAREVSAEESVFEGAIETVDPAARDLTLTAGGQTIGLHVPTGVPLTRSGKAVGFEQLRPTQRIRVTLEHAGEARTLARIEILT
jgi:hypothetical protein